MVAYSGSVQGLNPKETGPRSCYLVSVQNGEPTLTPIETDSVRWFHQKIDITQLPREQDLLTGLEACLDEISLSIGSQCALVRFSALVGRGELYKVAGRPNLLRDLTQQLREDRGEKPFVWTESVRDETRPPIDWQAWREYPTCEATSCARLTNSVRWTRLGRFKKRWPRYLARLELDGT